MARILLCAKIAGVAILLLGSLLLGPTTAMAEDNANAALRAYDSADSANRKVWELIFGNTYNGINWADSVLVHRKQQRLFCAPDNVVLTGPQVIEILCEQLNATPKIGEVPYGFAILFALQNKFPCS
jgi:hypothetical protein